MAKIKICGLTRMQDIEAVNKALPDYVGFVFAESRRQIGTNMAKALKSRLNPSIEAVGVFVNEDPANIVKLCESHVIDLIQLHGDEDEDYINSLRRYVPNKIIKAVRVKSSQDIERARDIHCDYLLFDAWHEKKYGGLGRSFDWSLITGIDRPYFLAGGINPANVLEAVKSCSPYCIDVSSGVETDGLKDPDKIMEIVTMVRKGG